MDLCVIMGNLLENAVEACRYVEEKFIKVRAVVDGDFLTVVVENSFDGIWRYEGGVYMSRKEAPETRGVGLSSVRAVCEKYGGLMQVDMDGDRWVSSALVNMVEQ
jgi:sensor histidine kinase regulating citrate/malate metabolism